MSGESPAVEELYEELARVRGEAAGARLVATAALLIVMKLQPDPQGAARSLSEYVDRAISKMPFVGMTPAREVIAREAARRICDESIASIRGLSNS